MVISCVQNYVKVEGQMAKTSQRETTSHFNVNNLKNKTCLKSWKHGGKKMVRQTISGVYLLLLSHI